ncbi:MAG: Uma2 family endonuclease [Cyanobacteria bacterium P01_D01_bin.1]
MIAGRSQGPYFTPEEYLQFERMSPTVKHEYRRGLVIAMAGAKKPHVIIMKNLSGLLFNHFSDRGSNCEFYVADMKVKVLKGEDYYYPDLVVTCDESDCTTDNDFIEHPKLIIEILSDSTEAFDRGDKFADYKTISELEEYVLVHQRQPLVERYLRKGDLWVTEAYKADELVDFASIEFSCAISALYQGAEQFFTIKDD